VRARIKEKQEVAKGTLLVTFDLLGEEVDFGPGQYFFVTLPSVGDEDDKGLRRHITVVTSPNEKGVLGFATRMLQVERVEHPLGDLLVLPERARLPEHRVDERRLAVVDVGDDREVPYVGAERQPSRVLDLSRRETGARRPRAPVSWWGR
jgi:hypothetical protein